jgi:hypothetical protein
MRDEWSGGERSRRKKHTEITNRILVVSHQVLPMYRRTAGQEAERFNSSHRVEVSTFNNDTRWLSLRDNLKGIRSRKKNKHDIFRVRVLPTKKQSEEFAGEFFLDLEFVKMEKE